MFLAWQTKRRTSRWNTGYCTIANNRWIQYQIWTCFWNYSHWQSLHHTDEILLRWTCMKSVYISFNHLKPLIDVLIKNFSPLRMISLNQNLKMKYKSLYLRKQSLSADPNLNLSLKFPSLTISVPHRLNLIALNLYWKFQCFSMHFVGWR